MSSNTFGKLFSISTWGESHGGGIGVVVDGCPPNLAITEAEIQFELDRRRPGQSDITTPRKETDTVSIVSGTFEGKTLGTPIAMYVPNGDQRPSAYSEMKDKFRPSHADYTYQTKYGFPQSRGRRPKFSPRNHRSGRSRGYCQENTFSPLVLWKFGLMLKRSKPFP